MHHPAARFVSALAAVLVVASGPTSGKLIRGSDFIRALQDDGSSMSMSIGFEVANIEDAKVSNFQSVVAKNGWGGSNLLFVLQNSPINFCLSH